MRAVSSRLVVAVVMACLWILPLPRAGFGDDLGAGTAAFEVGDFRSAEIEWRPLAEAGDPRAQYNLGILYEYGLGVFKDIDKAVEWYARSAEQGLAEAEYAIGNLYLEGYYGRRDPQEAADWYRLAADQGHPEAQAKLSELLGELEIKQELRPNKAHQEALLRAPGSGECPAIPNRDFTVKVTVDIPPAPIDHSRSISDLTQGTFHGANGNILGLMVPDLDISTQNKYGSVPFGDRHCFWVEHIEARMVYRSVKIYVAREYKKSSCAYREILRHEKEHVSIARRNLERYKPKVRSALTSLLIPHPDRPIEIESAELADAEMQRVYQRLLAPIFKEMVQSLHAAQGAIDTPASYAKVRRRCRKW